MILFFVIYSFLCFWGLPKIRWQFWNYFLYIFYPNLLTLHLYLFPFLLPLQYWNALFRTCLNFVLSYKVFIIILVILSLQLVQWKINLNSGPLSTFGFRYSNKRHETGFMYNLRNHFKINCICFHLDSWHIPGELDGWDIFLSVGLLKDEGPWSLSICVLQGWK